MAGTGTRPSGSKAPLAASTGSRRAKRSVEGGQSADGDSTGPEPLQHAGPVVSGDFAQCASCGTARACLREGGNGKPVVTFESSLSRAYRTQPSEQPQGREPQSPSRRTSKHAASSMLGSTLSSGASTAPSLTSGDLARACRTTLRTVRFYEEAGLLEPSGRSQGGHRLYGLEHVSRLSLVLDLREAGLSLHEVKELFALKQGAASSADAAERMTELLHRRIDEMQAKILALRRLREELAAMASMLRECKSCEEQDFPNHCGACDVMNRPDLPRAMRLLWG